MGLYDRLIGRDDVGNSVDGKIAVHLFQAVMGERARGILATNIAARDVLNSTLTVRGAPVLTAAEESEAITLLNTITGAANVAAKLARAAEIHDVLLLGERGASGYITPTQVKTRLGV